MHSVVGQRGPGANPTRGIFRLMPEHRSHLMAVAEVAIGIGVSAAAS